MDADLILVGGGLANSLIALSAAASDPGRRILMIDAGAQAGGHTWSFHEPDLNERQRRWIAPAIACEWRGQEVRFSRYCRRLRTNYASLTSASLSAALADCPSVARMRAKAERISADCVLTNERQAFRAPCVIDGTGRPPHAYMALGWQIFVGIELHCATPHDRDVPIIMDAQVAQTGGYRFVYTLPFTDHRILIEDTRYADGAVLDESDCVAAIEAYVAERRWKGAEVRRERGVLPVAMAFDAAAFWADASGGAVPVGMRAGLFHPVTGYSLPLAARVADIVAATPGATQEVFAAVRRFALEEARKQKYMRFLSRMMFLAAAPEERRRIMEHFYRLPEPLVERFYAGRLTRADQARILIGKPPVPIRSALACLSERPLLAATRRKRRSHGSVTLSDAHGLAAGE